MSTIGNAHPEGQLGTGDEQTQSQTHIQYHDASEKASNFRENGLVVISAKRPSARRGRATVLRVPGDQRTQLDIDHIERVADGGTNHPDNLRVTHPECNRARNWEKAVPQ